MNKLIKRLVICFVFIFAVSNAQAAYLPRLDDDLEIAKGNRTGHTVVNKFGENDDIASDTTEDIWDGGGNYTYPATALMTSMSQTTDQATLRGATIEWQGLDASWDPVTQTKALDASDTTTVITLDTAMIRVFRGKVLADVVGTSPVRCHNAGETTDYAVIDTGNNQTLMALYTVPNGKTAYMTNYYSSLRQASGKEPKGANIKLWVADRDNGYEFQIKHSVGIQKGAGNPAHRFAPYFKINAKNDIKITGHSFDDVGNISAGFDLILVDN